MISAELIRLEQGDQYTNSEAIERGIKYIYRGDEKKMLPICCYGCITYPPTCKSLIQDFYTVRLKQTEQSEQQIRHFIISFLADFDRMYQFADRVAKLFSQEYQVCYAYHNDINHPHFHYIVSAVSYLPGYPCMDDKKWEEYLSQLQQLAEMSQITLNIRIKNGR